MPTEPTFQITKNPTPPFMPRYPVYHFSSTEIGTFDLGVDWDCRTSVDFQIWQKEMAEMIVFVLSL